MAAMMAGHYHVKAAWDARGEARGNQVGEESWRGFFEHLTQARDILTAAWKLHEDYPEAPTLMVIVAMGGGGQLGERPREWFGRATAAQIDYGPAYQRYRNALLPRWGGSYEELQRLAMDCVQNKRFDTSVPWEGLNTIEAIVEDSLRADVWMAPRVYETIQQVCDGYAAAFGPGERRDYVQSYEAGAASRAARYPDARKALETLGDRVDSDALRRIGLMPRYDASRTYAFTGPQADALVAAEQKDQMHQVAEATAAYQKAADVLANDKSPNGRALHFVACRLQQLKWEKQFDAGEWVDVQPTDAEMNGWEPVAGTWTLDKDGTLTGKGDKNGLLLTFAATYLSPHFEIDGELDMPRASGGRPVYFGMSLVNAQPARFVGWWVTRKGGDTVDCSVAWTKQFHRELPIQEHNTVNMTQFDDHIIGRLNGHMTCNMAQMTNLTGPQMYVALGAPGSALGTEVHLRKLRVRKLADQPQ
jgi:hypothetical protein